MSLKPILLASGSRYRRELLTRLLPRFDTLSPEVDESARDGESPAALATRLAGAKAGAGAEAVPGAIVIGSDQVAELDGRVLGKPGDRDRAFEQLRACSGRRVEFHTAVCVMDAGGDPVDSHRDVTVVQFRKLAEPELWRYLDRDEPYDCAGSFKSEALGIALMTSIETRDPTALMGLPLIWLADCLRRLGQPVP